MDTKKLRQKILDLAIHGKLVPQDPNDEPASVLLERIRAEKERLVKEGKIKKSKSSRTTDTPHYENVPFEVPNGWVWSILSNLCTIPITDGTHQTPTYTDKEHGIPFISSKDVTSQKINWDNIKYITKELHEELYKRVTPQKDDILLAKNGTTGVAAIVEDSRVFDIYVTLALIRPNKNVSPYYLYYVINSGFCKEQFNSHLTGIGLPNLHLTDIKKTFIPLPPLTEQERIVSEIKRWFALIDKLEQEKTDLLTAIKQTKFKILDLAIHGKLVPQDPNDEPASELLKRINPKAEITCDNGQYGKMPKGWCLTSLGNIGKWQSGATPSRLNKEYYGGDVPWLKTGDLNDGFVYEIPEYITQKALEETSVKLNPSGSVLIAMYGATIGKIGILTFPATTNQACCACFDYQCVEQMYLFYFLLSHREKFVMLGGGGAQPNISKEKIVGTTIPLPPLPEQQRIVDAIDKAFAKLDAIMESLSGSPLLYCCRIHFNQL